MNKKKFFKLHLNVKFWLYLYETKQTNTNVMKNIETHYRTGGIQGKGLDTQFKTKKVQQIVSSVEEFIQINTPIKSSEKLISAIKKAYAENSNVTFNCGKGNQTFYFSEN